MDSYELLQDLDKKHGKIADYTVRVSPGDISEATKNVTEERRKQAKNGMAKIVRAKEQEKQEKAENPSSLKVEDIVVVDNSQTEHVKEDKDGGER